MGRAGADAVNSTRLTLPPELAIDTRPSLPISQQRLTSPFPSPVWAAPPLLPDRPVGCRVARAGGRLDGCRISGDTA